MCIRDRSLPMNERRMEICYCVKSCVIVLEYAVLLFRDCITSFSYFTETHRTILDNLIITLNVAKMLPKKYIQITSKIKYLVMSFLLQRLAICLSSPLLRHGFLDMFPFYSLPPFLIVVSSFIIFNNTYNKVDIKV